VETGSCCEPLANLSQQPLCLRAASNLCALQFRLKDSTQKELVQISEVEIWDGTGNKIPPSSLVAAITSVWSGGGYTCPASYATDGVAPGTSFQSAITAHDDPNLTLRVYYPCAASSASKVM
jgi:hypothetical protein